MCSDCAGGVSCGDEGDTDELRAHPDSVVDDGTISAEWRLWRVEYHAPGYSFTIGMDVYGFNAEAVINRLWVELAAYLPDREVSRADMTAEQVERSGGDGA